MLSTHEAENPAGIVTLESKLRAPAAREGWVPRRDLVGMLIEAADKKLILVEAPIGYGKTTALAQWSLDAGDPRPIAWLTLDSSDDDPVRLATYIVASLRRTGGNVADHTARIVADQPHRVNEIFVPSLVNELAVLPYRLVLVLDDYHHIRDPSCRRLMDVLIDALPRTVQLVIATRADPPLHLRREERSEDLLELRAPHLRFGVREADELLELVLGTKLAEDVVASLVERTEGWPAGVYLAALSLKGQTDAQAFVKTFAGDHHLVVDFLTVEVLNKQPPRLRRFLTRTSIFERFTASACDSVVGEDGSEETLEHLSRSNLFLVPLGGRPGWFRYHRLFQELLRSELRRSEPEVISELHKRAHDWHRKWGFLAEAIGHAIAAEDISAVRDLVGENWWSYWEAGRIEEVRAWLDDLGWDRVESDPELALIAAWTAGLMLRSDEARRWTNVAELGPDDVTLSSGGGSLAFGVSLVRSLFGSGGVAQGLGAARAATTFDAGSDPRWRAQALASLGYHLLLSGDPERAVEPLTEAAGLTEGGAGMDGFARAQLAILARAQGDRADMRRLVRDAYKSVDEFGLKDAPIASAAYLASGLAMVEEDHAQALAGLDHALDLARLSPWWQPWIVLQVMLALAPIRFGLGERDEALGLLAEASEILERHPDAGIFVEQIRQLEGSIKPGGFGSEGSLTDREMAVLNLLPTSFSQREIGTQLYLSINTVKSHTRSIYRKLGVGSRAEAIAKARRSGLI